MYGVVRALATLRQAVAKGQLECEREGISWGEGGGGGEGWGGVVRVLSSVKQAVAKVDQAQSWKGQWIFLHSEEWDVTMLV